MKLALGQSAKHGVTLAAMKHFTEAFDANTYNTELNSSHLFRHKHKLLEEWTSTNHL